MLLKTIYCKVEEEKKELFSKAQEKWRDIQHLDGFHWQFGGWNEDEACVFTLWENKSAYQSFMNGAHDTIYLIVIKRIRFFYVKLNYSKLCMI